MILIYFPCFQSTPKQSLLRTSNKKELLIKDDHLKSGTVFQATSKNTTVAVAAAASAGSALDTKTTGKVDTAAKRGQKRLYERSAAAPPKDQSGREKMVYINPEVSGC